MCDSTVDVFQGSSLRSQQSTSRIERCLSDAVSHRRHASTSRLRQRNFAYGGVHPRTTHSSLNVSSLVSILLCLVLYCGPCIAAATTQKSVILFDSRPPPEPRMRLIRRAQEESSSGTASTKPSSTTSKATSSSSTSTTAASAAIPSAFDTSLGNNFTTSTCPDFFHKFLSNDTFNDCVPLSLLLQTSTAFFSIQRSPVQLAQTLGASCNVNFTLCSAVMAELALDIQLEKNCGADYQAQNPSVLQAYDGFVAYKPLYQAGCLENSNTGSYCFSDAITNATSPTNSYVYYLPLGVSLPSSSAPTCSTCLRNTMSVFASAATNSSQPINAVYASAAKAIDSTCGQDFINVSIPVAAAAASSSSSAASSFGDGVAGFGSLAFIVALGFVLI